ncbi:MAG: hypothetical protein L6R36_008667 [Xanthoria steineri]|nr:MAG: hypothetical protein L6R36_008667 [Xanthoria steineri]
MNASLSENGNACAVCGKVEEESNKLSKCARCKARGYCGKGCQTKDWDVHKKNCKRPNYILKVTLRPDDIQDPQVYRTLSCPSDSTFEAFHEVLQVAFSWASTHTFDFKVRDPAEVARIAAEEENDTQEQSIMKLIQSIKENGRPGPQERY